jgi:hypothetical protein
VFFRSRGGTVLITSVPSHATTNRQGVYVTSCFSQGFLHKGIQLVKCRTSSAVMVSA